MKSSSILRLAMGVLLAAVLVGTLIFLPVAASGPLYRFLDWVREMGAWGPLLLGAAYVLAVILFLPGSLLTMGAGFVFGVVVGTITVSAASTLGAAGAFVLGRTLARRWVEDKVARHPKFRALDDAIGQRGFQIVLLLRLSPVFPFNLLNYALGLTKASFLEYVLASWIGMLPGTLMYVYLGSTLKSLTDVAAGKAEGGMAKKLLFGLGLLATIAVTVLVTRLARKALRQAVPSNKEIELQKGGDAHAPDSANPPA